MAKVTSVQEIFENLDEGFQSDKAEGVNAIFQFDLTGDNGGKYWVKVQNKKAEVHEGEHASPTMVLTAVATDYVAMINGELPPMTAFMQGRIKVKGDMGLALKLQMFDQITCSLSHFRWTINRESSAPDFLGLIDFQSPSAGTKAGR
jgi:putative sterol carrier protein